MRYYVGLLVAAGDDGWKLTRTKRLYAVIPLDTSDSDFECRATIPARVVAPPGARHASSSCGSTRDRSRKNGDAELLLGRLFTFNPNRGAIFKSESTYTEWFRGAESHRL